MAIISTDTFATAPNFLESAVGVVLKTHQIPDDLGVSEGNRLIVKAGTPYPADDSTAIGIVFTDVDVTDGDAIGSVLVEGRVLADRLDISDIAVAALNNVGIKFISGGEIVVPTAYSVTAASADHGSAAVDKATAYKGETVTITITPASGYKLGTITVTDVLATKVTDTKYTFVMPGKAVTVACIFTAIS